MDSEVLWDGNLLKAGCAHRHLGDERWRGPKTIPTPHHTDLYTTPPIQLVMCVCVCLCVCIFCMFVYLCGCVCMNVCVLHLAGGPR